MKNDINLKANSHKNGVMKTETANDFKGTIIKLVKYFSKYKISLFFVIVFAILSTVFNIVGPKILGNATTLIYEGIMNKISDSSNGIDFGAIAQILIFLIILYALSAIFSYIQGFLMTNIAMKTTYTLRKEISYKLNKLPLSYFDNVSTGDILSRVTNDVDTLNQSLNQSVTQIITSISTVVGILIMMLTINLELTLIALLIIPISLSLIMFILKKSQRYFYSQQKYLGLLNGHVEEMYSGHIVIKAFNKEKYAMDIFDNHNEKLYHSSWKSQFLSGLIMPIMFFISNLGYVAICIIGGHLVIMQKIAVGDIQAFLQYVRQFTQPLNQIANISNILQQTTAAAERVFDFLDEKEETPDKTSSLKITFENNSNNVQNQVFIDGSVSFDHIKFGYSKNKIIIKDFSANIKPGQKVAIVGPTGAGKTTIVKLLMRFYDVLEGKICLSGHNIKDFSRNDLRSIFGMVLQETWLYNASIKDNIKYGNLQATDEEIHNAAKSAHVEHFINTLPGGYNMIINESADNISAGQKQLLTIARAIISNPKILIFDEATSSVDTRTEILIQKAMENLMHGKTSFIIAHRLSTIKNADLILVMNNGDIVEQGTHKDLLGKNGFYANLYSSQFK
ncbi:predicted ABC-type transporter ATPase and permease component [Clostridium sp. CAG:557]|jgi:ATP-binding cassette subfamily B multidrug efflux pump|nr:predicted ABC-type transporter ATPase and permease component [Clostridium sp. CAG:557]